MPLYYPPQQNGLQKTLDAQLDAGVTDQMTLNNVTNVQNKPGIIVINRIASDGTEKPAADREFIGFTGTSGNTLTGLTRNIDGGTSDQDHAVGSVVEFVFDITQGQALIDALKNLVNESTLALDPTKVVDLTTAQTLTNKTLTSPVINTGVSGTAIDTDGTLAAGSDTKIPSQKAVKTYVDGKVSTTDGWNAGSGTWTYSSADGATGVITVPSGAASIYTVGDRIKITQTTVKYGIVTVVADTALTVYFGTDYTLANADITNPYYSHLKSPLGFPTNPIKWTVETTNTTNAQQNSPSASTWYNISGVNIVIPIGCWRISYKGAAGGSRSSGPLPVYTTLSTANNSESDADFTSKGFADAVATAEWPRYAEKTILLASKTTYYWNTMTDGSGVSDIRNFNGQTKLVIRAICAYL